MGAPGESNLLQETDKVPTGVEQSGGLAGNVRRSGPAPHTATGFSGRGIQPVRSARVKESGSTGSSRSRAEWQSFIDDEHGAARWWRVQVQPDSVTALASNRIVTGHVAPSGAARPPLSTPDAPRPC